MQIFGITVPPASIIGFIGEESSGIALQFSLASKAVVSFYVLDNHDPIVRLQMKRSLIEARRRGSRVLIASWDEALLKDLCDEVWWIQRGKVVFQGDPRETLALWAKHIALRWREEQAGVARISPSLQRGDRRAVVKGLELLDCEGQPVLGFLSGEECLVRVSVEFLAEVAAPVIGMLIRTRVGVDVYGTNTELEKIQLGPARGR